MAQMYSNNCLWQFENDQNKLWMDCSVEISNQIEYSCVGAQISVKIGRFHYNIKKINDNSAIQSNNQTKKMRNMRRIHHNNIKSQNSLTPKKKV